jgi:ABC-2 type transport system ATP-binding protein
MVQGVRRAYGNRRALNGVDLSVGSGEIYGLLGPNGAGKTSLVRAISGRIRLDAGRVRISDEDPVRDARARRLLGLVPQDLALYSELTARENLEVFAGLMGLDRASARTAAEGLLVKIRLADRADDRVGDLSGGMKRRLNIAAGVIHHPQVLLLDEPTVGVDPAAREDIHDLLFELRRDGLAILLTTHDLEQAAELSDTVGILIEGRLRAQGSVESLIRQSFGDGKELLVTFKERPESEQHARLGELGLGPSTDERVWTGRVNGGLEELSALGGDLADAGLEVEEARVRESSLRGVYFRFAGREIDA